VQTGAPQEVFGSPVNEFVAHFAGIRNFFKVSVLHENGNTVLSPAEGIRIHAGADMEMVQGYMLIRSEDILLSAAPFESSALNNFQGQVTDLYASRNGMEVVVDIGIRLNALISLESFNKLNIRIKDKIWVHFKASSVRVI
jgi:molybdopterin-binding protein